MSDFTQQGLYTKDGDLAAVVTTADYSHIPEPVRHCAFCNSTLDDDVIQCPSCGAMEVSLKCPACGTTFSGGICPTCREKADRAAEKEAEKLSERFKEIKANQGLIWKCVLTFFLPCIGGYFLITPHTQLPYRLFGIIWCIVLSIALIFTPDPDTDTATTVAAVVICLAPVVVYAIRELVERSKRKRA